MSHHQQKTSGSRMLALTMVMSHIRMRQIWMSHVTQIWMSHVTSPANIPGSMPLALTMAMSNTWKRLVWMSHVYESRHTHMNVSRMNESRDTHMNKWGDTILKHIGINESRDTHMTRIWTSEVTPSANIAGSMPLALTIVFDCAYGGIWSAW